MQMKDICVYKPGDLNKNGKEGKTSWDSFSYMLLMGHNVWTHIEAVQRANREFDAGQYPYMMRHEGGQYEYFADIVERIFAAPTKQAAMDIIDTPMYASPVGYWSQIIGTRGFKGKKATNAHSMFNNLFEIVEETKNEQSDEEILDSTRLRELESNIGG
jgi:hypothetical protein